MVTTALPTWAAAKTRSMAGSWGAWPDMNKRNIDRLRAAETKGTVEFILYGDSITAYHFGYQIGYKPPASDIFWKKHFGTLNAVPLAIPGDQIGNVWYRMAKGNELPKTPPKVIGLLIGVNDSIRFGEDVTKPRVPPSSDRMDRLLQWIHETLPTTEVILCAITPTSKTPRITQDRNALNTAYKALVTKHAAHGMRIVYADCSASFTSATGTPISSAYSSDGIHITGKGHDAFLKALRTAVDAALVRAASAPAASASSTVATVPRVSSLSSKLTTTHLMLILAACVMCCMSCVVMMSVMGR